MFDAQGQALPFRDIMVQLQRTFGDLSLEVFDANGELKDGEQVMQEYANSLPITQQEKLAAIVDLFGTRAMPTMLAIIQQGGTEFDKLAGAIDSAAETGTYAAEMAETQMDNLQGAWTRFTSALGTTKIMLNDLVSNELKSFVERLTEMVKWFNSLDEVQKENVIKWGLIAAAVGPVLMLFGNLLRSIGLIMEGFKIFNPLIQSAGTLMGTLHTEGSILHGVLGLLKTGISSLFTPMTAWIAIIGLVIAAVIDLWKNNEEFRENVKRIWNSIVDLMRTIWDALKPIFDAMIEIIKVIVQVLEPLVAIVADILAPVIEIICNFIRLIFEALKPLIQIITDAFIPVIKLIGEMLKSLIAVIKPVLDIVVLIFEAISTLIKMIVDGVSSLIKSAVEKWLESFNRFFELVKLGWETITNWFKNSWLGKLLSKFGSNIKDAIDHVRGMASDSDYNPFISGSHANGLAYVPYDGYVAELHKGERVLTAQENARYSSTSGVGNGTTINFYSNERIDEYTAAKELRRTMKDIELGLV